MPEEAKDQESPKKHPDAKRIRYIRDQITPSWGDITKLAKESGLVREGEKKLIVPQGFRKYRKKEMEKRLQLIQEGEIDELTKVPNRKGLLRRINEETERLARLTHPNPPDWENYFRYDVLFIDLNDLKKLNDLSKDKHSEGDKVLKKLAEILSQSLRPGDFVGRWGGDEFVLMLHRLEENASRIFWERLSQQLHEEGIWVSAGLAKLTPENTAPITDENKSIKLADQAMYLAKATAKQNRDITGRKINMMRTEKDLTVQLEQSGK